MNNTLLKHDFKSPKEWLWLLFKEHIYLFFLLKSLTDYSEASNSTQIVKNNNRVMSYGLPPRSNSFMSKFTKSKFQSKTWFLYSKLLSQVQEHMHISVAVLILLRMNINMQEVMELCFCLWNSSSEWICCGICRNML